jgi:hypothetical protein
MKRLLATSWVMALVAAGTAFSAGAADLKDFAGTWIIRSSVTAPWKDPKFPLGPGEPGRLIGQPVTFATTKISGPSPIGCAKPVYKVETVGPDMIFEGELAEPRDYLKNTSAAALAAKLGFADPQHIVTLDAGCTELQFHEVKSGTLVFGLNNRVYYMTRN